MPCGFTGCAAAHDPLTNLWNVGQLCTNHLTVLRNLYPEVAGSASLRGDIVKIHFLFNHRPAHCLTQIGAFEAEMVNAANSGYGPNGLDPRFGAPTQIKVSRAFEYYEGYCWFPANRVLLTGLLSGPDFLKSLQYGFNKDHFPDRKHGEQSHRFQWHAIMRLATDGFTTPIDAGHGWSFSPIELFYEMTVGQVPAAFARAMDSSGNPHWGNPDNVVTSLQTAGFARISAAVNKRVARHGGSNLLNGAESFGTMDNAIMDAIFHCSGAHTINPLTAAVYDDVIRMIYKWRKAGVPFFMNNFEKDVKKVYDRVLVVQNNPLTVNPVDMASDKSYKRKGTNLLVKKDAPESTVKIDGKLVAKSRTAFNPKYIYSNLSGARPNGTKKW